MRISDWSSDVCSSDLRRDGDAREPRRLATVGQIVGAEPVWLHDRIVETIHTRQLAEHGGVEGVRDRGLLATALAKPLQLHSYGDPPPDLPALAAAYAHGIAHLPPFVDGNKRTSFVAALLFLRSAERRWGKEGGRRV